MQINREILNQFLAWKNAEQRKPLLLKGARQIGKSWAMEEFGKRHFLHYAVFNFDRQPELTSAFQDSKSPDRILKELALYTNVPLIAGETLLIFDEIQECESALNALKYFYEDAPEWHIIAAGSLLGVAVKQRKMTVPVGKVQIMRMYPLSFREFLYAADNATYQYIEDLNEIKHLPTIILNKLRLEYQRYLVCGGMPEVVSALLEGKGMQVVEQALQDILDLYELDFAKYAQARDIPRIRSVWHSLPSQLSKENRKFVYKLLKKGARSKDYEDALLWLEDAGIVYRVNNCTRPGLPLSAYEDVGAFKLYACDTGLLRRLAKLPVDAILGEVSGYKEFKGAMAENAVLQSLVSMSADLFPYYWTSESQAEVEYIIQWGTEIIPIEVKAENNISGRSLSVYTEKYHPKYRMRFSMLNLQFNEGLLSCPAALVSWFPKWLNLSRQSER